MILNFIAHAVPPLDTLMLREAISVLENVGNDDVLDPHSIMREDAITRLCRSFIRKSNDGLRYEFAHYSVQEFLEGEMMSMPGFEAFQVSESICQLLLAKQCLKYLVLRNFSYIPTEKQELHGHLEMRIERYPFYYYAALMWPIFAKAHWADESLVELAKILFQPQKTGNFISWALELTTCLVHQVHFDYQRNYATGMTHPGLDEEYTWRTLQLLPRLSDRKFTTLHMAPALSLPIICSSLIDQGAGIDQRSSFGTPLQCAVQRLYLADDDFGDSDNLYDQFPYDTHSYWQGQDDVTGFGTENTIRLLLRSGASRVTACSSPFQSQTLITVALRVAFQMESFDAAATLVEAGYSLEENDLEQFTRLAKNMLEYSNDASDEYRLKDLILSLSPVIDTSPAHFRLCQEAWSLAIDMRLQFVRDPNVVDTRISLSQEALAKRIITSVWDGDIESLERALKDPRADVRGLSYGDWTVLEIWLRNLECVTLREGLTVLRMLLSAGMEVNEPNRLGLLPIHQLASKMADDRPGLSDDYGALCEIVREFIRRGTGCDARSQKNQNVFHLGLRSLRFIKTVLKTETEDAIQTALRTRDEQGYTPITFALQAGKEEVALLLWEKTNCNHETLSGPTSVYAHCVTGGANRAFNILLDAGVELEPAGTGNKTLLHYVGPRTREQFVRQLIRMFPDVLRCRIDAKIPLDTYFENCIRSWQPTQDGNVVRWLAGSDVDNLYQGLGQNHISCEDFLLCIQNLRGANLEQRISKRNDVFSKAIDSLLQLRIFEPDEADAQVKWIFQLLTPLQSNLDDLWPVSSEAIRDVLGHTSVSGWETLRRSAAILRLLQAAVNSFDVDLVELLLKNGVSVHQRIQEMSALETACTQGIPHAFWETRAKGMFTLLLNHAELHRLNEINPYDDQERGLLHRLTGYDKQWHLEQLLKRGVDVNLCTSVHADREPAVVQHVGENSPDSAMTLLDHGANPAIAGSDGMDTALTAALQGQMGVLLHIHTSSRKWQLNWEQTCDFLVEDARDVNVSGANALHLAAQNGYCDVLRFYLDEGLLTDVNAVTVELFTPLHLAAFRGRLDTIKFLCSRGGQLNLKAADGSLPLHLAVRNEHPEVVEFLAESGSAMDADMYGLTPVGYAMQLQNQSILDYLRTTKQYLDYRPKPGRREQELIYHSYEQALIRGDVDECERLHGQGCPVNVDLPGQNGRTALVLAIENSNENLVRWLLDHDAKAACRVIGANRELLSPIYAIMARPALGNLLPLLLRKYHDEGGSVPHEEPSLICGAIVCGNNFGLKLLLEHIAIHESANQ